VGLNVLLLGIQGSGKGTQAKRIAADYGLPHVSTGDMFRALDGSTAIGRQVLELMARGELVPEETGAKAYALLRQALEDESKVGVAKVSFRDKEHLAGLRFKDEVLVLETMYWPDEIRAADFDTVNAREKVRDNEVEMAKALIQNLSEPWNPEQFKDEYREALLEVVEKKAAGQPIEAPEEAAPARVVDLMEALKASVEAAKGKTPSSSGGTAKRSSAKRSSSKKSTAKSSAKKTAAPRKKAATG